MKSGELVVLGFVLVALGLAVIFAGILKETLAGSKGGVGGEVRGGGVIMIGPVPLVFGTDRSSVTVVIVLALALMLMAYLLGRGS